MEQLKKLRYLRRMGADEWDLSYRRLAWATNWYLREETLKSANAAIVDFHHGLDLLPTI